MTSLRLTGAVLVFFGSLTLAASPARAERSTCDVGDDGGRFCGGVITCDERRDCIGDTGTEDWYCEPRSPSRPDALECMAACTTMFGCGAATDCPPINGQTPTCQPAEGESIGVCTYRSGSASNVRITYCADGGGHVTAAFMAACHTLPRAAGGTPVYTPDYYLGDCDGDGCANGADTDPCSMPSTGGSCAATGPAATSPYCPPPPPLACVPQVDAITCDDARPCSPDGAPCDGSSTCEDGWSDGPRCRPECGSLFLCNLSAGTLGGSDGCPPLGGRDGVCMALPAPFPAYPAYGGVCVYGFFADGSCDASRITSDCFVDSTTMMGTANFYQGDCDGDLVPNGCDSMVCVPGSDTIACEPVPGAGCDVVLPVPDAGVMDVDAGTATPDSGNTMGEDAGNVANDDASTTNDAGNVAFDAGNGAADASGGSFSGGGGCRCSAGGGERGGAAAAPATLIVLGAMWARRRRQ
jgi:MYXO-CTERM domain-containing protein